MPLDTSTTDTEVISADTEGTDMRPESPEVRSPPRSSEAGGAAPTEVRPLSAATYSMPLSSKCSARIS